MKAVGSIGFWKRSIKTKIGIMLFIIIICIFGLSGVYRYMDTKSTTTKELDELSNRTITRLAEQLILPLWEVDNLWVRKIITSEMRDKRIFAISVIGEGDIFEGMKRDTDWRLIAAADDISGDYITKSRDIVRDEKKIGSVNLYITKRFMISELRWQAGKMFLTVILFGVFCLFFLLGMLHKIVIHPINRILRIADGIANGNYHQDIIIHQQDEIGILGRGFDSMQKMIRQREEELLTYHEHLEELVKERTTDLAIAKEVALETKRAAEAASQAKSLFLANMSHELRTPMNAILGYSQLMQRDVSLLPAQHEYLDTINRSGEHLLALINNVLEISKIEAGQTTFESTTFDLRALLLDLEKMFDSSMDNKGLQFEIMGIDAIVRYVATDENKLRQVLVNLLDNAVKFTERGGVAMRVAVEAGTSHRMLLKVEVADTGVGIAEDEMDKVFAYFEQTASGRAKKSGTGLGLALSRDFARTMGGDITVTSKEGKGSTFYFNTDIREGNASDIKEKIPEPRVIGLEPGQDIPRVLVAEDAEASRTLLVEILKSVGLDVQEAVDGKQAVEMFHMWRPHFIWMDVRMPVMDGLEATRRIKETGAGKSTPIAALTAHALEEEKEVILASGCNNLVRKPYRIQEIFDLMAKHLGIRYEYAQTREEPVEPDIDLHPELLATLPEDLLGQLYQAVVELDEDWILALIEKIKTIDARMAAALDGFVKKLALSPLLDLLEKILPTEQEDGHG